MFGRVKPLDAILATAEKKSLHRSLGAFQLTMLGIGAVIGTGIFVLTAEAAQKAGPGMMLSFVIAGLVCAVAALCYAEMAFEGLRDFKSKEIKEEQLKFHGFTKILIISFATSLDAFGVGIGLGVAGEPIFPYVISIGIWAFSATIMGLNLAKKLSQKFGSIVTLFGATVLMIIAFQMLKI